MKKIISILLAAATVSFAAFGVPTKSNETHDVNWSNMTYTNVPIVKIIDSKDGYVVIYSKNKIGEGKTVIPKRWTHGNAQNPSKFTVRSLPSGTLKPFMTVIKKDGQFHRVIVTVPDNRRDPVWGVVKSYEKVEGTDKESLEELEI